MRSQVESGAELLTRLNSKSSLYGLDNTLFFEGLRNTDIIEINGEQSTGKTLFLSSILAKCILPNVLQIKGCNASAILINTDHHFQISKLLEVMSNIIDASHTMPFVSKTVETSFDKTTIIQDSLRNLHIIDCYNSEQFSLTLHTLEDVFLSNAGIALLAIDSISAYYWQDRGINTISTLDSYIRKLLKLIKASTTRFNVATVYTRPCETSRHEENKFARNLFRNIDYRINLHRTCDSEKLMCTLETVQTVKKIYFSILSHGIEWELNKNF